MRKSVRTGLLTAVALSATALVGLFGPTSANAAPTGCGANLYPPKVQAQIQTSTTTPASGASFEASGINYVANENVKIYIGGSVGSPCNPSTYTGGTLVGTGHTDSAGKFDPSITMPTGLSGAQLLVGVGATGQGYDFSYLTLNVAGTGGTSGNSSQPPAHTGVDIALMFSAAAVLIGAGVVFLRGGRRRRIASHT